jgi:hypothetical protein
MSGLFGAVVLGVLIAGSLFVVLLVLGCARAAGRADRAAERHRRERGL